MWEWSPSLPGVRQNLRSSVFTPQPTGTVDPPRRVSLSKGARRRRSAFQREELILLSLES
jgi:hypothetical protein